MRVIHLNEVKSDMGRSYTSETVPSRWLFAFMPLFAQRRKSKCLFHVCMWCVCESWVWSQSIQVLIIIFVGKIFFLEYFLNLLISGPKFSQLSSTIKVACREIYEQLKVNICTQSHLPFTLHFTWQLLYNPWYVNQGVLSVLCQTLYSKILV